MYERTAILIPLFSFFALLVAAHNTGHLAKTIEEIMTIKMPGFTLTTTIYYLVLAFLLIFIGVGLILGRDYLMSDPSAILGKRILKSAPSSVQYKDELKRAIRNANAI